MNRLNKEAHIVEELNGVRCSIVEKNATPERVQFLKRLLEYNRHEVIVAPTPPPPVKPAPKPVVATQLHSAEAVVKVSPEGGDLERVVPSTFTVGVTNISFHSMLAVYERSLFTPEGKTVSIAFWNQEPEKEEELYWMRKKN